MIHVFTGTKNGIVPNRIQKFVIQSAKCVVFCLFYSLLIPLTSVEHRADGLVSLLCRLRLIRGSHSRALFKPPMPNSRGACVRLFDTRGFWSYLPSCVCANQRSPAATTRERYFSHFLALRMYILLVRQAHSGRDSNPLPERYHVERFKNTNKIDRRATKLVEQKEEGIQTDPEKKTQRQYTCLLYTSDAADE